ncbi:MAG TPA: outer membrane beta-barrel domain-containing protein [Polyangia bacterium]
MTKTMRAARAIERLSGRSLVAVAALTFAGSAWAAPPTPEEVVPLEAEGATPAPGPTTRVTCLDDLSPEGQLRKGVQKRDFLKRHKLEISLLGGWMASDALSSTYTLGGGFTFFLGEEVGIELLASHAPVRFRLEDPFVGFDEPRRFVNGSAQSVMAGLVLAPIHAKFKLTEATILHGDISFTVGAGRTIHDSVQGLSYEAGAGLRLYLMSRLAFRFELRDLILPQEILGVGRTTHNLTITAGFSFWLG